MGIERPVGRSRALETGQERNARIHPDQMGDRGEVQIVPQHHRLAGRGDRETPVQPHPEKSKAVRRIFDLYSLGNHTFRSLADQLEREGHVYRTSQTRFGRTALSYILSLADNLSFDEQLRELRVEFNIVETERGPRAVEVRPAD